jgi:hypothetical protein
MTRAFGVSWGEQLLSAAQAREALSLGLHRARAQITSAGGKNVARIFNQPDKIAIRTRIAFRKSINSPDIV